MPKHYVQLLRKELIRKIKLSKIKVLGFRFVDRIAFNGCRKRKVRQVV